MLHEVTMSVKPRIAVIVGSTRPTRFADKPAQWIFKQAQARGDIEVELVDLRDFKLPFFDEKASNMWMPSENPEAVRWQQTIARLRGSQMASTCWTLSRRKKAA